MNLKESIVLIKNEIKIIQKKKDLKSPVKIIAVTKTHPFSIIKQCYKLQMFSIGENKIQEAESKFESFEKMPKIERRFIGHLQSNKINKCLKLFDTIDTIDSFRLAKKISNAALRINKKVKGLIQINTSEEIQKTGFYDYQTEEINNCFKLPNLEIEGLMTIGPNTKNKNQIREAFIKLGELKNLINKNVENKIKELSMGMSGDYKIAIEEGSTMIRLGTILFGSRSVL